MTKYLKSTSAFVAALAVVAVLSHGTDIVLQSRGFLVTRLQYASWPLVIAVIAYRNVYNVVGGYLIARLAPRRPMLHSIVLGSFGLFVSLAATIVTLYLHVGPVWYGLGIAALALPSAWLGGKLWLRTSVGPIASSRSVAQVSNS